MTEELNLTYDLCKMMNSSTDGTASADGDFLVTPVNKKNENNRQSTIYR